MAKNAYIHIPFCKSKCKYCSFVSFSKLDSKDEYLTALKNQIVVEYKGEVFNTFYFGGGTPSLLTIEDICSIISLFKFSESAEITIEVNPDSVDAIYLNELRKCGINRISIGSQTFDDEILKIIGRRHNSAQIFETVRLAKEAGFENISVDLIYGLPSQTIKGFENDLKKVTDLGIQHVSLYGLKIEDGCYFSKCPPIESLPDLDSQADMYKLAVETLKNAGFEHYEISNFSLAGFNSKHNMNYWYNNSYYGLGLSASGYIDDVRYTNESDVDEYLKNPLAKISELKLTEQQIMEEEIFLGFRKMSGINIEDINTKFGIDFEKKYANILKKYEEFLIKTANGYALSVDGILISNEILMEFLEI